MDVSQATLFYKRGFDVLRASFPLRPSTLGGALASKQAQDHIEPWEKSSWPTPHRIAALTQTALVQFPLENGIVARPAQTLPKLAGATSVVVARTHNAPPQWLHK